jgi:hypothetical protein
MDIKVTWYNSDNWVHEKIYRNIGDYKIKDGYLHLYAHSHKDKNSLVAVYAAMEWHHFEHVAPELKETGSKG